MQELIKKYYKLVDKMADKAYEESQSVIEPLLRQYGLKKLSFKVKKVDYVYDYNLDVRDMFIKKSDVKKINEMSKEDLIHLEADLLEKLRYIFEEYPASVVFQMLENINTTNKHSFVIKIKY